ncbi:hypothetical protein COO60DRAFT_1552969, partial [Scenedesmus sp. NREL 46B-D3]
LSSSSSGSIAAAQLPALCCVLYAGTIAPYSQPSGALLLLLPPATSSASPADAPGAAAVPNSSPSSLSVTRLSRSSRSSHTSATSCCWPLVSSATSSTTRSLCAAAASTSAPDSACAASTAAAASRLFRSAAARSSAPCKMLFSVRKPWASRLRRSLSTDRLCEPTSWPCSASRCCSSPRSAASSLAAWLCSLARPAAAAFCLRTLLQPQPPITRPSAAATPVAAFHAIEYAIAAFIMYDIVTNAATTALPDMTASAAPPSSHHWIELPCCCCCCCCC